MKKIAFITNKYPNSIENNVLVFLQQLVWEIAELDEDCIVICPVPVNINPKYLKFPYKTYEKTENGSEVTIYFPKYIGFGQSDIFGFNPAKLTTNNFTRAVKKVIGKMNIKPDALYGHFVTPAGITAARVGREFNIPSFMAYGEATSNMIKHFGYNEVSKELASLDGVISVSTQNKNILLSIDAVSEDIIEVFPNGYREERFYPRDKQLSRSKFNLPEDKFIVCFVGSFDHRKGIERLISAVNELDDVYVICGGKGELVPESNKCLYNKSVDHADLPYFYSAADVFVLPTLNEGCCNAIIEAMACGLPIISSNQPFNDDILDDSCSIRINPLNVKQIKQSIAYLYNNEQELNDFKKGSLKKAESFKLKLRAKNIIYFIGNKI